MPTPRILIVYGTGHGQTAKIARRMADVLHAAGDAVTLADIPVLPRGLAPDEFDGVIVGASIHFDRHQDCVAHFVRAHRDALNAMPSGFFSVSGAAAGTTEADRARARRYVDEFLRETGWRPGLTESVAGAMAYTRYSPVLRWMAKHVSAKGGGPTDTSRDHEFTDWAQVERFAGAFAMMVPHRERVQLLATA